MRIIDLSSDVCSSDLPPFRRTSAGGWSIDHPVRRPSASNHARSVLSRAAGASPAMRINFQIAGSLQVPDALCPLDGATNQYRLPTGEVISVHPVIEIASGPDADDHRDLGDSERSEEHTSELKSLMRI